jgi:hypothetical protein
LRVYTGLTLRTLTVGLTSSNTEPLFANMARVAVGVAITQRFADAADTHFVEEAVVRR